MSTRPSKIVCVGRSYAAHIAELGNATPDRPVLFIKPPSSLVSLQEGISWNENWGSLHHECEVTLRIDQPLKGETNPEKALEAIGAVTLGLDLTLRDLQDDLKKKGQPWERAKAFDGSCVLADWVSIDEVKAWDAITFEFAVNDQVRQKGDTSLLIFDIGYLLADISQVFALEPGDVVMTGTPAGVGALASGDQLTMTLNGQSQDFVWKTFVK
ncbi:fumarylacetoacetate hydrolase family protein [Acinetobacter wuhouensis]|uniref:Fumarylacetoacetate hydrolase family protein n=1 Tax=Acinetobacter wuhouensis TaxID=1879050 RepID=A0A3G2T5Q9_9GAMM|nr:fumarylacetoacetate hydrolase family protein [Acinetobacter wuhouensis]AYO55654.1 fumarylacetoacetate hydrolase family protein [Acinetobacter wuhouensis]